MCWSGVTGWSVGWRGAIYLTFAEDSWYIFLGSEGTNGALQTASMSPFWISLSISALNCFPSTYPLTVFLYEFDSTFQRFYNCRAWRKSFLNSGLAQNWSFKEVDCLLNSWIAYFSSSVLHVFKSTDYVLTIISRKLATFS